MSASREEDRVSLLISLGHQPGVSAWFNVWQLARLGRPASEVWGAARRPAPAKRPLKATMREHCHP